MIVMVNCIMIALHRRLTLCFYETQRSTLENDFFLAESIITFTIGHDKRKKRKNKRYGKMALAFRFKKIVH
jgi:hypothetical protein